MLLALAVAAFALTRAERSQDDLVNTVRLPAEVSLAELAAAPAEISFTLARAEDAVTVQVVDGRGGSGGDPVRTLAGGADLAAGPHAYEWDGTGDGGDPVPAGPYALRVTLGAAEREIQPPGRIEVVP